MKRQGRVAIITCAHASYVGGVAIEASGGMSL
jgi:hypothetical protein